MTDEDLIARLRKADEYEPLGHDGWEAADRIEALVKDKGRLSEALALIESMTVHSGGEIHGVTIEHYRTVYEAMRQEASIALDEIGYGTADLTQKDRADD